MRISLNGTWEMETASGERMNGQIPGCSYLFLLDNHKIDDPYWGTNEAEAKKVAEQDFIFRRTFTLDSAGRDALHADLVLSGVDTLADISLNGQFLLSTNNAFRTWRIPVKEALKEGENLLEIKIQAPHDYMKQKNQQRPIGMMLGFGMEGLPHIRKPQYSFGWDWGPALPAAGIDGDVYLDCYEDRFEKVKFSQIHQPDEVTLKAHVKVSGSGLVRITAVSPDGKTFSTQQEVAVETDISLNIKEPQLWWCNGMGDQPLYTVTAELIRDGRVLDLCERKIGLRTITLDTEKDQWGHQFRFRINGEPIFAKGADWIPADQFISRVTREKLEFYIRSARDANMNMLRVWGGGYYESDDFYDLCDQYGILVWQDFCFACNPYPLDEASFLENVAREVEDQVARLHTHPSLALWCGNNEILMFDLPLPGLDRKLTKAVQQFFYVTLKDQVTSLDQERPYWYGSPSSRPFGKNGNSLKEGDTHLWQIWHGLDPIEGYRKLPTRFCSEFGLESFPSMASIRDYTDAEDLSISQPDIANHQKSAGGNEKILYYNIQRYGHPADFESMVYFSQLMQADGMRYAVEYWRRNLGRCNGALYWQYNDCWPVASWASVDYAGDYKALQYHARDFYAPTAIISETTKTGTDLWIVNDRPREVKGDLRWECLCMDGEKLSAGTRELRLKKEAVIKLSSLSYEELTGGVSPAEAVLVLRLYDKETGELLSQRNQLLVKDRDAKLPAPQIRYETCLEGREYQVSLTAEAFAHIVLLRLKGKHGNFSDNFFDLIPGQAKTVTFTLPEGMTKEEADELLTVRSFVDFPLKDDIEEEKAFTKKLMKDSLPMRVIMKLSSL